MTVIEKLDGTRINLFSQGIITLDFVVSPIDLVFDSETVPGRPGRIRTRSDYGNRKAALKIMVIAQDQKDMSVMRDKVAELLDGLEPLYFYESTVKQLYSFEVPGEKTGGIDYSNVEIETDFTKKLLLQRTGNESLKFNGFVGHRAIEFETYDSPFWIDGIGNGIL